jgi:tetratricopeptide (TPR) repeat protein
MGESTIQSPKRPVRRPYHLPVKKKKTTKWWKRPWDWTADTKISIISLVASAAAVFISVHYNSAQKNLAEEGELVKLTTTIAGQLAQQPSRSGKEGFLAHSARLSATDSKLGVEAREGVVLISDLENKKDKVSAIEYIEVAQALAKTGDNSTAANYYKKAKDAPPHTPVTRAAALRYLGELYYYLYYPDYGRKYLLQAADIFREPLLATPLYVARAITLQYVTDAYFQLFWARCDNARKDMAFAEAAMVYYTNTKHPVKRHYNTNATIQWYKHKYNKRSSRICGGNV